MDRLTNNKYNTMLASVLSLDLESLKVLKQTGFDFNYTPSLGRMHFLHAALHNFNKNRSVNPCEVSFYKEFPAEVLDHPPASLANSVFNFLCDDANCDPNLQVSSGVLFPLPRDNAAPQTAMNAYEYQHYLEANYTGESVMPYGLALLRLAGLAMSRAGLRHTVVVVVPPALPLSAVPTSVIERWSGMLGGT